jgi:hypothetical protein
MITGHTELSSLLVLIIFIVIKVSEISKIINNIFFISLLYDIKKFLEGFFPSRNSL